MACLVTQSISVCTSRTSSYVSLRSTAVEYVSTYLACLKREYDRACTCACRASASELSLEGVRFAYVCIL